MFRALALWRKLQEALAALSALFGPIDLATLLEKAAELFQALATLWPLPDLTDSAALRAWVRKALDLGDRFADLTATEVDDTLVGYARAIVDNDTAWDAFARLAATDADLRAVAAALDDPKIDPATLIRMDAAPAGEILVTIIAIITAILELIRMFRNRNN